MREVALYGTQVVKVTGNYDQAKQIAAQFAKQRALYVDQGVRSITTVDSMKTIAFEIAEQLAAVLGSPGHLNTSSQPKSVWRSPDWYFQSVSGGLGPVGVLKGFSELKKMGIVDKIPAFANIQAEGCAPMVHGWKAGMDTATPVQTPRTHIATLATGDPGRTYTLLRQRMLDASGGTFESVSDEEAFKAMHILAKMEGISVEPATAVAFAGLIKMIRSGQIKPTDVIVVNCTGHTVPVEQEVIGDNWAKDVEFPLAGIEASVPAEDGLLAALNRVSYERYPKIAIVDDHPHVRQLIRRILQAQGEYELSEAADGKSALSLIKDQKPDLIILDLMMPEMDGFSVLDALRRDPNTASIPVIVVTAQELTNKEKERLEGQIQSLMQKGDFMNEELLEEVRTLTK
jgi:threonine synthase